MVVVVLGMTCAACDFGESQSSSMRLLVADLIGGPKDYTYTHMRILYCSAEAHAKGNSGDHAL